MFPDAVTLSPDVGACEVLGRIAAGAGASVKDSFARLDLRAAGFVVVVEARWIVRAPAAPAAAVTEPWQLVRTEDDLAVWEDSWAGGWRDERAGPRTFPDELRADPRCVFAMSSSADHPPGPDRSRRGAHSGSHEQGGATRGAAFHSSDGAVGVSNVFGPAGAVESTWEQCLAFASATFGPVRLVGYESGDDLAAAEACGFEACGSLRVWLRP
jgi:hypothetical protein